MPTKYSKSATAKHTRPSKAENEEARMELFRQQGAQLGVNASIAQHSVNKSIRAFKVKWKAPHLQIDEKMVIGIARYNLVMNCMSFREGRMSQAEFEKKTREDGFSGGITDLLASYMATYGKRGTVILGAAPIQLIYRKAHPIHIPAVPPDV